MDTIFMPKNAAFYECKKCDFSCSKESNWNKHLMTRKHQKSYIGVTKNAEKMPYHIAYVVVVEHFNTEVRCGGIKKDASSVKRTI